MYDFFLFFFWWYWKKVTTYLLTVKVTVCWCKAVNILKISCQYFLAILLLLCIESQFLSRIQEKSRIKKKHLEDKGKNCSLNDLNQNILSNIFIIMIIICCWSQFSISLALSLGFCCFLPFLLLITLLHGSGAVCTCCHKKCIVRDLTLCKFIWSNCSDWY